MIPILIGLTIDKNTTRFTPAIAKARRHSAPTGRARVSPTNDDSRTTKGRKGNEKLKEIGTVSEPEFESPKAGLPSSIRKDSLSHPKPILKRPVQGQSTIPHSRKVRFPSPDIEAVTKRKTNRMARKHNAQPFQWMAKRPKRKARIVDIDRLLEEEGSEELWDDVQIIDNADSTSVDEQKKDHEAEPNIILQENPFAPQVRFIDGRFVLETNNAAPTSMPMEIVEEED